MTETEPIGVPATYQELARQRLLSIFQIHMSRPWWISQATYVCKWLDEIGLSPKSILDLGCGDGRYVLGIEEVWPDSDYTGIDKMEEHITINKERMPHRDWVFADFTSHVFSKPFDTVLIMGTFNPKMPEAVQTAMLGRVVDLGPKHIVCLFDKNQSGDTPDLWIQEKYRKAHTLEMDREYQSENQNLVLWVYERQ